jgi:hypothetical protein
MSSNDFDDLIKYLFGGIVAAGGLGGLYKILTLKSSNKLRKARANKTDIEATTMFSTSVLEALRSAQKTANSAQRQAARAMKLARMAQEEVAYYRRWIIDQGLVPPEYVHQLEGDEIDYNGTADDGDPVH